MIVKRDSVAPIDFSGLRILDYTANLDLASSFAVVTVPPGGSHPVTWSKRSDKYYWVVAGTLDFALDGETHTLSAGDFCLVPQGQRFSYQNPGTEDVQLVLVHTPSFDLDAEVFEDD